MLAFVVNKVVTFNSKRISEKVKRRTPVCDHSDNGPVMIYRGEGGKRWSREWRIFGRSHGF